MATWKDDLSNCLRDAELDDLRYSSQFFTWFNRQDDQPILRKLDRVLVNHFWEKSFALADAKFVPPGISDHAAMVVRVDVWKKGRSPFRFFDFWMENPRFLPLVVHLFLYGLVFSFFLVLKFREAIWDSLTKI